MVSHREPDASFVCLDIYAVCFLAGCVNVWFLHPQKDRCVMTNVQLEEAVKKVIEELALVRAQHTLLTVFLDRLDGFSREAFEREFAGFWETQGGVLAQSYSQELGLQLGN